MQPWRGRKQGNHQLQTLLEYRASMPPHSAAGSQSCVRGTPTVEEGVTLLIQRRSRTRRLSIGAHVLHPWEVRAPPCRDGADQASVKGELAPALHCLSAVDSASAAQQRVSL